MRNNNVGVSKAEFRDFNRSVLLWEDPVRDSVSAVRTYLTPVNFQAGLKAAQFLLQGRKRCLLSAGSSLESRPGKRSRPLAPADCSSASTQLESWLSQPRSRVIFFLNIKLFFEQGVTWVFVTWLKLSLSRKRRKFPSARCVQLRDAFTWGVSHWGSFQDRE